MLMSYNRTTFTPQPGLYTSVDRFLSSRDIGTILSSDELSLGIDKVKVFWFPKQHNESEDLWRKATLDLVDNVKRGNSPLEVGYGTATLRFSSGNPGLASVEFNPSTVLHYDRSLATLDEAIAALAQVLEVAAEYVAIPPQASDYGLSRIDLTVDFEPVSDMQHLLHLASLSRPYRTTNPRITKSHLTSESQSVSFTTKSSGKVIFYDKSAERREEGRRFRVEVTLDRKNLQRLGQSDLSSLTESALRTAAQHRLQHFVELCLQAKTSKAAEILQFGIHTDTLVKAAGYECLAIHGVHPKKTKYWDKKYSKFKKLFPHTTIGDLM
jgi:hypothetical protein